MTWAQWITLVCSVSAVLIQVGIWVTRFETDATGRRRALKSFAGKATPWLLDTVLVLCLIAQVLSKAPTTHVTELMISLGVAGLFSSMTARSINRVWDALISRRPDNR
jgi:hypothetical protein